MQTQSRLKCSTRHHHHHCPCPPRLSQSSPPPPCPPTVPPFSMYWLSMLTTCLQKSLHISVVVCLNPSSVSLPISLWVKTLLCLVAYPFADAHASSVVFSWLCMCTCEVSLYRALHIWGITVSSYVWSTYGIYVAPNVVQAIQQYRFQSCLPLPH